MLSRDEAKKASETYECKRLSRAKELIESNPIVKISLEQLAKMSNMSITNFRREWKRVYKNTPLEYRDVLRLQKAKELLALNFIPIVEVAEKCGFEDGSYFVRFFKKQVGLTPGEYRKSIDIL
jgi:AraC-like DNA-binding protein